MKKYLFFLLIFSLSFSIEVSAQYVERFKGIGAVPVMDLVASPAGDALWVASEQGLWHIQLGAPDSTTRLTEQAMSAVCLGKNGRVFVANYDGQVLEFQNFKFKKTHFTPLPQPEFISDLYCEENGKYLLVLTRLQGVYRLDLSSGVFSREELPKGVKGGNQFASSEKKEVYVASDQGILERHSRKPQWKQLKGVYMATALQRHKKTWYLAGSLDGSGLNLYESSDLKKWKFSYLPVPLRRERLSALTTDAEGNLWAAGRAVGKKLGRDWEVWQAPQGLPSRATLTLAHTRGDTLWVGTAGKGLFSFPRPQTPPAPQKNDTLPSPPVPAPPSTLADLASRETLPELTSLSLAVDVHFQRGSAALLETEMPDLQHLLTLLRSHPSLRIRLEGHTDFGGSKYKLLRLSEERAKAVRAFLVKEGIQENRVVTQGFGGTRPLDTSQDPAARQQNRRVEVRFLD